MNIVHALSFLFFYEMRFVAFPATEYDEVLSGCQPADSPREFRHIPFLCLFSDDGI
jgi:hypothetical protein